MDENHLLETDATDLATARTLLTAISSDEIVRFSLLKGGANNRVYKMVLNSSSVFVFKHYFQHPQDPRPRLKAEYEFLQFAWRQGIRSIPQPHLQNTSCNAALYSYVEGSLASVKNANASFIRAAIAFLEQVNREKTKARHLLKASESCFRIEDFIAITDKRIDRLLSLPDKTEKLSYFFHKELIPKWISIKEELCKADLHSLQPSETDYILTPSDFGLHNVLITPQEHPIFIDFEYAGWDDPAKTICDFFLQPKIPIPFSFLDEFAGAISQLTTAPEKTKERALRMLPVCKIKWCCIILNVFLQVGKTRRDFAKSDQSLFQEQQIELARNYLKNHGIH